MTKLGGGVARARPAEYAAAAFVIAFGQGRTGEDQQPVRDGGHIADTEIPLPPLTTIFPEIDPRRRIGRDRDRTAREDLARVHANDERATARRRRAEADIHSTVAYRQSLDIDAAILQ